MSEHSQPQFSDVEIEYRDYMIEAQEVDELYVIRQLRDEYGEYGLGAWVSISYSRDNGCGGTGAVSFETIEQCKAFIDMRHRIDKKIGDFLATVEEFTS